MDDITSEPLAFAVADITRKDVAIVVPMPGAHQEIYFVVHGYMDLHTAKACGFVVQMDISHHPGGVTDIIDSMPWQYLNRWTIRLFPPHPRQVGTDLCHSPPSFVANLKQNSLQEARKGSLFQWEKDAIVFYHKWGGNR
jgi:hypothetical protein